MFCTHSLVLLLMVSYAKDNNLVTESAYKFMKDCDVLCKEEIHLCNNLTGVVAFAACENAFSLYPLYSLHCIFYILCVRD